MRRFLSKIFLFLLFMVVIDQIYGYAMEKMRLQVSGGSVAKNEYVCDKINADVLIFGSSRARMQYDPKIIGDSLGMTCYNCGQNGMGIIFDYARMKVIARRYMPKMIIIDVLPILYMMKRDDNIIFVNEMRPWYHFKGVDSVFWRIDSTERYKMYSKMYSYHSKFLEYLSDRNTFLPKGGYDPVSSNVVISNNELNQQEPTDNVVDSLKLYYLEKFIQEYKDKTRLFFIVSPRYNFKTSNTVVPLKKICVKYSIPLFNHYADPNFVFDKSLHKDGNHLNAKGASLFSKEIAKEIHHLLEEKNNESLYKR